MDKTSKTDGRRREEASLPTGFTNVLDALTTPEGEERQEVLRNLTGYELQLLAEFLRSQAEKHPNDPKMAEMLADPYWTSKFDPGYPELSRAQLEELHALPDAELAKRLGIRRRKRRNNKRK